MYQWINWLWLNNVKVSNYSSGVLQASYWWSDLNGGQIKACVVVRKRNHSWFSTEAEWVSDADQRHADLFSERPVSTLYLRLRSAEVEAYTTQEILARHAGKTLRRTEERKRKMKRKRRSLESKEEYGFEERRTGTGWWEDVRDRPETSAVCTERESRGALQEEEQQQQRSTEEADR